MQPVMFSVCLRIKRPARRQGRRWQEYPIHCSAPVGARPCRKLCLYIEAILLIFNIK